MFALVGGDLVVIHLQQLDIFFVCQADEGYDNLHGVDYSETAIELSRQVAEKEGYEGISFSVLDLTYVAGLPAELVACFDLILDKGTFDAITLAQTEDGKIKPTSLWVFRYA